MESSNRLYRSGALGNLQLEELARYARKTSDGPLRLRDWTALAEAWLIAQALRENRGNRSAAARALGIGRRTLYTKMDKLGLVPTWGLAPGRAKDAESESPNDESNAS